jgi:molybdopterin-biosynthesis enzyme MoeA-like protein
VCVIIGGMVITLLCIGDELLDGRILNTNQQTLSKLLWESGYTVSQAVSVGDSMDVFMRSRIL